MKNYILAGLILASLFCCSILTLPITSAEEMIFRPNTLVNISTVLCREINNSLCSNSIGCNMTIINSSSSVLFVNVSMSILANGFRGLNTNLTPATEQTLSAVTSCDNGGTEPFLIRIEFDEDLIDVTYWLNGFILITACSFFIIGMKKDRFIYKIFSGFFLMLLGIELIVNGFPNIVNAYLTEGSGIIMVGLGLSFIGFEITNLAEVDK